MSIDSQIPDSKIHWLHLRPARPADEARLLEWSNDLLTRRMSFAPTPIAPAEHAVWFAARLADPSTRLWVAELYEQAVGLVRFTHRAVGEWELGVTLEAGRRGQGLGAELIQTGCERLIAEAGPVRVLARTRPDNAAFRAAAARAGFVELGAGVVGGQTAVELEWRVDE